MTANIPLRAATSGDLANYRAENQAVKFGLAIKTNPTVYTARINQTFDTLDNVIQLTYDGGSGTLADVLVGMTCYVGSSAGARDKGIVRIRKTPTESYIYIGATSEIQFGDDDYLTIVDDFAIWGRDVNQAGDTILIDSDMEFSIRGALALIRAAPMVAVIKRVDGVATFTPPSPALSACYDGATISSYQYAAPGAATTENMTSGTGTASWTYEDAGQYRWSLTVTDSNGRTAVTYRWVFVDPTYPDFVISSNPSASSDDGGWSFGVTMYDNATTADIVDRAMVTLYTDAEYFGGIEATIGKLTGYENIIATGWIDGESIVRDSQAGTVTFSAYGAAHWMKKAKSSPLALSYVSSVDAWGEIASMTVDKGLAYLLTYMSTVPLVMDCFLSSDTTPIDLIALQGGNLFDQMASASVDTIFADPMVNSLGQLFVQINPQMLSSTDKSGLTTVMAITSADYENPLDIERLTSAGTAMVELQCNVYDGTNTQQVFSRAPGNIGAATGDMQSPSNYYAASQAECNRLAGVLLAVANPQYSPLEITLAHQNRLIDICPSQYCTIGISADETPRGIALTNQRLIPRKITLELQDGGWYKTVCEFEVDTTPIDGITYYPPSPEVETVDSAYSSNYWIGSFPTAELDFPPTTPLYVIGGSCGGLANSRTVSWSKSLIKGNDEDRTARLYYPCIVRPKSYNFASPSRVMPNINYYGDAQGRVTLYGIAGGARVLTADSSFEFDPAVETYVDGFEIELEEGIGTDIECIPLDVIASGSVNSQSVHRLNVAVPAHSDICIEDSGYWTWVTDPGGASNHASIYAWDTDSYVGPGEGTVLANYGLTGSQDYYAEQIGSGGAEGNWRVYMWTGEFDEIWIFTNDGSYSDNATTNSGSLGYVVRNAQINGRRITLSSAAIQNVCPPYSA